MTSPARLTELLADTTFDGKLKLRSYLVNHAEAIRDLVVAAEKIGGKVTDASNLQISIADVLSMKEALAKLEEA